LSKWAQCGIARRVRQCRRRLHAPTSSPACRGIDVLEAFSRKTAIAANAPAAPGHACFHTRLAAALPFWLGGSNDGAAGRPGGSCLAAKENFMTCRNRLCRRVL